MTLGPRAGRPPRTAPAGAVHRIHHLGPHPIIAHFLERLTLEPIIRGCVGSARQGVVDHARTLAVLVHNLLVSPGPLYRIATWLAPVEPQVLGSRPRSMRRSTTIGWRGPGRPHLRAGAQPVVPLGLADDQAF